MTVSELIAKLQVEESRGRGNQEVRVGLWCEEQGAVTEGREVSVEVDGMEEAEVVFIMADERRESYISRGVKESEEWSKPGWMM